MNQPQGQARPILARRSFRLRNPAAAFTQDEFELLAITTEDLRYLRMLVDEDLIDSAPAARLVSTTLRRLLSDGDLGKAARLAGWKEPLLVRSRMLDYTDPHPGIIATCGGGRCGGDRMPDTVQEFGGPGIGPPPRTWGYREDVETDLS